MKKPTIEQQREITMRYLKKYAVLTEYSVKTPKNTADLLQIDNTLFFTRQGFGIMYSTNYAGLYDGGVIPPQHFVWVDRYLMRIEQATDIYAAWEMDVTVCEWYRLILNRRIPRKTGTRFYLDDKLYTGIPFKGYFGDLRLRNWLLRKRKEGQLSFKTLKIKDAEDKITLYVSGPCYYQNS